ncbi:LysR family transcriptional regulator [Sphingomonas sp. HMWF008]|nr:LysR family transcriptional regulator [Sphingomonas sp. HMWF008]
MLSPRAEALRQPLAALWTEIRTLLSEPAFDPAAENRTLRLAMTDAQATVLLAPLVKRVAAAAPGVVVQWVPVGPGLSDRMISGEVDLTLVLDTTPLPRGAASELLMTDSLAVVVRAGHPSGGVWPIAHYATYPSVIVSLLGDRASDLDAELAASGIERPVAAIVPTFRAAAEIVAVTDAVTTISRAFAERVGSALGLQLLAPPLADPQMRIVTVWATYRGTDPLLAWFRATLRAVADDAARVR